MKALFYLVLNGSMALVPLHSSSWMSKTNLLRDANVECGEVGPAGGIWGCWYALGTRTKPVSRMYYTVQSIKHFFTYVLSGAATLCKINDRVVTGNTGRVGPQRIFVCHFKSYTAAVKDRVELSGSSG